MNQWYLVDNSLPVDGPEDFPKVAIRSEAHLREVLETLRNRRPAIFGLDSPDEDALEMGIGGPFWGLRLFKDGKAKAVVLADQVYSVKRIDFAAEEDSIAFWPESLIPANQAVEVAAYFFNHHCLPKWIGWKEWNPDSNQWIIQEPVTTAPVQPETAKV